MKKIPELFVFDRKIRRKGFQLLAGCDEAGRGPLAGPLVAAVVVLPVDLYIQDLNDSKKLTAKKREKLFQVISTHCLGMGIAIVDEETIDRLNVFNATYFAMRQAFNNMNFVSDCLLVDGNNIISGIDVYQESIVGGDGKSAVIAAASIVAKVTRDRIMQEMDGKYPGYDFARNKGYGTKSHMEAISKYGPCVIHRKTFQPVKSLIWETNTYNLVGMEKK